MVNRNQHVNLDQSDSLDAPKGRVDFQHFSKDFGTFSLEIVLRNTVNKQCNGRLTSTGDDGPLTAENRPPHHTTLAMRFESMHSSLQLEQHHVKLQASSERHDVRHREAPSTQVQLGAIR